MVAILYGFYSSICPRYSLSLINGVFLMSFKHHLCGGNPVSVHWGYLFLVSFLSLIAQLQGSARQPALLVPSFLRGAYDGAHCASESIQT